MDESTNINDITLECFINKNCKDKYLKNHKKAKYDEITEHYDNIRKHKNQLLQIFTNYIDDKDFQLNHSLDELFQNFTKAYFQHLDFKNTENNNKYYHDYEEHEEDDENMLFGKIENDPISSFWGSNVRKI